MKTHSSESFFGKSPRELRKIQAEAAADSQRNMQKETDRLVDVKRTYAEEKEKKELSGLMFDGETFTRRSEIARQVHSTKTTIGDQFPRGPRGGKLPEFRTGLKKIR